MATNLKMQLIEMRQVYMYITNKSNTFLAFKV